MMLLWFIYSLVFPLSLSQSLLVLPRSVIFNVDSHILPNNQKFVASGRSDQILSISWKVPKRSHSEFYYAVIFNI